MVLSVRQCEIYFNIFKFKLKVIAGNCARLLIRFIFGEYFFYPIFNIYCFVSG